MSRCGCIGQIAPGISRSSLNTRRFPKPMYSGSRYVSNEKCHRARNHPPSVSKMSSSVRTSIVISPSQPVGGLPGVVGEDEVGAGAADRGEDLEGNGAAVDPAAFVRGLHHRVLAAHVERGHGVAGGVLCCADDV